MSTPEEEEITIHQVRPRFKVETDITMSELTNRINEALNSDSAPCRGFVKNGHGRLMIPPQEQHYWSPQLSLSMEEEDGTTTIRGLYGPRPVVWTMFVFFYAAIGFAILIVSLIGASYLTLEKSASILWAVPILVVVFLSLYFVAYSGKKLGYDQIVTLHGFVEECTGLDIKG